jgi:16S rRNA (cytosine967-C5)-methyltransferase
VVEAVLRGRADVTMLDARSTLGELDDLGAGPFVWLWPHRHDTDAMFLALLRRVADT